LGRKNISKKQRKSAIELYKNYFIYFDFVEIVILTNAVLSLIFFSEDRRKYL